MRIALTPNILVRSSLANAVPPDEIRRFAFRGAAPGRFGFGFPDRRLYRTHAECEKRAANESVRFVSRVTSPLMQEQDRSRRTETRAANTGPSSKQARKLALVIALLIMHVEPPVEDHVTLA